MKVVIVGNGALGLTSAYRLLKMDQGVEVTLVGPFARTGNASLAAAAMYNSFCELDKNTLIHPMERKKFLLNRAAAPMWPDFLKEIEEDTGQAQDFGFGTFLIQNFASDRLSIENFGAVMAGLNEFEEPHEMVSVSDIPKYDPEPSMRAAQCVYIPNEGWMNPTVFIHSLHDYLSTHNRVTMIDGAAKRVERQGDRVAGIDLESGDRVQGDQYLLAPGASFTNLVEASNLDLPFPRIYFGMGASILLLTEEKTLTNCIRTPNLGLACGLYSAPHRGGRTLIGASNHISHFPEEGARLTSVQVLMSACQEQIQRGFYNSKILKVNLGWRPTSEDTMPLLGETPIKNLFVATGNKRDGLHSSPFISQELAKALLGQPALQGFEEFQPSRKPIRFLKRDKAIEMAVEHTINAAFQHGMRASAGRMLEDLSKHYQQQFEDLHDQVGAKDWGIPPEMLNMYKYGHTSEPS